MLFIIFLISQVCSEWVEITQSNYRRNPFIGPIKDEYTTAVYKMYSNDSLTTTDWRRGQVDRVNGVGNVKRVPSVTNKTLFMKPQDDTKYKENEKRKHGYNIIDFTKPTVNHYKKPFIHIDMEDIRKDSQVANDKRKPNRQQYKELTTNLDRLIMYDETTEHLTSYDSYEWHHLTTKPTIIKYNPEQVTKPYSKFDYDSNTSKYKKTPSYSVITTDKYEINKQELKYKVRKTEIDNTHNINKENLESTTPSIENNRKLEKNEKNAVKSEAYHPGVQKLNKVLQDLIETLKIQNDISLNTSTTEETTSTTQVPDLERLQTSKDPIIDRRHDESSKNEEADNPPEIKINPYKTDPLVGVWKFLKVITDIISKNTKRGVKSKINYLEELKNNILYAIEERIDQAWPDEADLQGRQRARETRSAEARGHVEFPSSEGALMSISFLTFAVFLIKLVLQVIQTYKNKTMMVTPTVMAAVGRAASALKTNN